MPAREHLGELVASGGGRFQQQEVVEDRQVCDVDLRAVFAQQRVRSARCPQTRFPHVGEEERGRTMTQKWCKFYILAVSIAATTLTSANADPCKSVTVPVVSLSSMETRCPTAVADEKRVDMQFYSIRPREKVPTDPSLRIDLLRMARKDQNARFALIRHRNTRPEYVRAVKAVDAKNLKDLKQIFRTYGIPTPEMVGYEGMNAALLLLQHQNQDPAWQRRWLRAVTQLYKRHELSPESYALFVDRVRVNEGRKQIYGTQFFPGGIVMKPTLNPAHLDERREKLALIPENQYKCLLSAMYNPKATKASR